MEDVPIYIALALTLGYLAVVGILSFRKNHRKHQKRPQKKRPVKAKQPPRRQFSDERFSLNLMAMEAARQMAVAALKSSNGGQKDA